MDTEVVEPSAPSSNVHLLVLCHGLWGTPEHLHMLERLLMERWKREHQVGGIKLVILAATGNRETNTYDGIDLCAERVTQEIDELTREQEKAGNKVVKFSIVGYSLGGLIARFVLGLLHARNPSYFDSVEPASFTTFATPHIGIPKYPTFWSPTLIFLGSKFLSRSGGQLYARDDFHQGRPLIEVMTQEGTSFMTALRKFPKISIYASALNDRTVSFPTGAIQRHDMFARAERRMLKGRSKLLLPEDYPVDLREGGLKITTSSKYPPLIDSYESCTPVLPSSDKPAPKKPWYHFKWPLLLKPSGYPFFPPVVRYIVVFTFPIIVPFFIVLVMGRFVLQNFSSRRRIKAVSVGELKTREGRLRRVNLMLDQVNDMLEDSVGLVNAASLPSASDSTLTTGQNTPDYSEGAPLKQSKSALEETRATDPVLTEAQSNAMTNLCNIKQLERYLAYFPTARNAHGTIICRTESFPGFKDGIPIVQHWADHFPL